MLLAIMNIAYIKFNTKVKKVNKQKVRILRVIFYFMYKDNDDGHNDGDTDSKGIDPLENNFMEDKQNGDLGLLNLEELGIYSKNEEDYKLWAINCAEEIRQENIDRAKLKQICSDEMDKLNVENLNNNDSSLLGGDKFNIFARKNILKDNNAKQNTKQQTTMSGVIETRIKYWNYLRRATQILDLQNGIIEKQNKKMVEKLERKNNEYASEIEKTNKMYSYIAMIERPVSANLEVVDLCQELKSELDQYKKL